MEQAAELIRTIQKGLLQWYTFIPGSVVLYTGSREDALAELLTGLRIEVICASCSQTCDGVWLQTHKAGFDYIVSIADLETQRDPCSVLQSWHELLKPCGKLLLGMNNRLGLRYFCGDRDPYTARNFDGVENYRRAYVKKEDAFQGRCYSQAELKALLRDSGWDAFQFFSVLPDLHNPCLLYAEDCLPNEDLANRLFPTYNHPDSVFLEEESLYSSLIANGMFHQMANAYLIECSPDGEFSDVQHVTNSTERGREDAFMTVIHRSGIVEKRAVCPEGCARLERLLEHNRDLSAHGIQVVETTLEHGVYTMPYVNAEIGQVYLKRLLLTDKEAFLRELDHFRDLVLRSSGIVKPDAGDGQGAVLRHGYVDMVPLNSFHQDSTFIFFDQEFCVENYPANAIITRIIATFYAGNVEFEKIIPRSFLFDRYGLTANLEHWQKMEWDFLAKLRKEKELRAYHEKYRRSNEAVHSNRQRMNYSDEDYQRLFVDIFRNADTRKLILFGSGAFTKKFLALYDRDYPVYAIVDNSEEKWGRELEGIRIHSPELLRQLESGEYKVLICIKNYPSVMKQLDTMGVAEYSIYDPGKSYPRKQKPIAAPAGLPQDTPPKKYHTGYVAGVFDLFHVGHLNMFKRAKEQCDYLIVGVVTDEWVRESKKTEPFVPLAERLELVRACRYVDEVVELPLHYSGIRDAWRLFHFDCQFSGSDYADNPGWLADKAFLEKHGAEMVFFPYTEGTSSSKLKSLIESKLL